MYTCVIRELVVGVLNLIYSPAWVSAFNLPLGACCPPLPATACLLFAACLSVAYLLVACCLLAYLLVACCLLLIVPCNLHQAARRQTASNKLQHPQYLRLVAQGTKTCKMLC